MRRYIVLIAMCAAAAWAAGPEAAGPAPPSTPSPAAGPLPPAAPAPAGVGDGAVPPATVTSGAPGDSSSAGAGEVVLLSSGEGGCTFEVKIPEPRTVEVEAGGRRYERFSLPYFLPTGKTGAPELLMRRVHVAAPPGAVVAVDVERTSFSVRTGVDVYPRPRLEVEKRHGEETLREVFAHDARAYREGIYPAKLAEIETEEEMRGYRLISVAVYPYQYQPAAGTLKVATSVVVRVSFRGGVRRPTAQYPARPAETGIFTRVAPAVVLNYEVASRWPFAGGVTPSRDAGVYATDFADKAALKVVLDEEALYRLSYGELKAAGFPVDTLDPANLRLFAGPGKELPRDFYYEPPALTELPIYVAGQDDGRFDETDYVEFYGHGCDFFEHVKPGEHGAQVFSKDRYTRYNFYWLVADAVPGKRMAVAPAAPAGGVKPAYFWDRIRLEEDNQDVAETEEDIEPDDEYWYWRIFNAPTGRVRVKAFTLNDPVNDGGANQTYFEMMVREEEGISGNGPHHTKVYLNDHLIFEKRNYTADDETYCYGRFDSKFLIDGQNRVYFEEDHDYSTIDFIMLDHFEFEYPRRYRAYQDYLHFSNPPGTNGKVLFEVAGFTTDDLVLYDVTRGRRLTAFEVNREGGEYTLRFTDDVPSGQCWYVAASSAAAGGKPRDVYLDAGSKLRDVDENVDLIVVTYDGYYDNVMPLVNLRRAEGLNVLVARVTDVYDEFSWGLYDPGAIRLFVKDIYRKAAFRPGGELPDHLLLVGDAFVDHRDNYHNFDGTKLWRDFGRNQIPTYYVNTSPSGRSSSDNVFVAMNPGRSPDLAVGRLSAPFDDNIDAIVEKIVSYRRHPANGPWNSRFIFVADNDDKSDIGTGGGGNFTRDNEDLEADYAPLGFEVHKENIEWMNRRFPTYKPENSEREIPGPGFDHLSRGERQYWVGEVMKPDFLKGFNSVIMHYAGHGGPQVWSHENLFLQHKDIPPVDDVDKLENGPYLPVIIQCSCSTAYFDQWYVGEGEPRDFGQCISEYILQAPRKAGVAALGSTRLGTEGAQNAFLQVFYSYLFPGRKARANGVTLGEAHLVGKIAVGSTIRDMFVILGDPSMTLATPRPGLKLTPNKGRVKRGEKLKIAGEVPNNFNGAALVQLFDRPWYFKSYDESKDIYRDRLVAAVEVGVVNGRFEATLAVPTVPVNPTPGADAGMRQPVASAEPAGSEAVLGESVGATAGATVSPTAEAAPYYVSSLAPIAEDGIIYVRGIAYGGGFRQTYVCNETLTVNVAGEVSSGDNVGPDVDVYLDDYSFRSGDPAGPSPTLLVELRDESGILVARDLEAINKDGGEKLFRPLTARITKADPKEPPTLLDLAYYYKGEVGDYRAGSVEKEISLTDGVNKIAVTAYDGLGNKSERNVQCVVSGALAMAEVMNCPNPFKEETYFTFISSTDVDSLVIKIYTATGRLIRKLEHGGLPAGYNQIRWDGLDGDGDRIANGVYFYTITARAGGDKIIARQKMFKLR
jgi:hypothetical protein